MSEEFVAPVRGEHVEARNEHVDYSDASETAAEYERPDWDESNPIPVYIVSEATVPELTRWTSGRAPIADQAASILSGRRNRIRAVVRNLGVDSVYLGTDQQMNTALSFELPIGAEIEFTHSSPVWAKCAATETATVSFMEEFTVALNQ